MVQGPNWKALLRLGEWLVYLLCGSLLVAGTILITRRVLSRSGLVGPWQEAVAEIAVACVILTVFLVVLLWDVRQQRRRSRGGR
jgi:hypothetical protein